MDNSQDELLLLMDIEPNVQLPAIPVLNANFAFNPSMDLEWYSSNYIGFSRVFRLEFVADNFPQMRIEALKLALMELSGSYNTETYQKLHEQLVECLSANGLANTADESLQTLLNPTWFASKNREFAFKSEKLMNNLRSFKASNIKENVRKGYNDLGDHYINGGDLTSALKYYARAWDYCTTGKHMVNTCLNKIKVVLLLNQWTYVLNYISEAERVNGFNEIVETDKSLLAQLKSSTGIAELGLGRFEASALSFLQVDINYFYFPEMISSNNVAIYAGLCALATFDRPNLRKNFIQNSPFKAFLELEPDIRDVIHNFYNSKYSLCLKKLADLKDNLMLDIYLAPHVDNLYKEIRIRGIQQYFSTYSTAKIVKMAEAFNTTYQEFYEEIFNLIMADKLPARIDSLNKLLVANEPDTETETYERALRLCDDIERTAKSITLRALFKEHNIMIK